MKLAFIGIGHVGFSIADRLQKLGHEIIVARNDAHAESLKKALTKNPAFTTTNVQEAVNQSDLVFLATPFGVNQTVLKGIAFNGKTLVDCTNPVGAGITHGLKSEKSGAEAVQEWAPDARVVKAFNIYGYENFVDNVFPAYNVKPVMLIAGNNEKAKKEVSDLLGQFGFFPKDTGALSQSLHLEHMTLLWVKMVRMKGHHPHFVWAYLEK
jgi:hypothetical protein